MDLSRSVLEGLTGFGGAFVCFLINELLFLTSRVWGGAWVLWAFLEVFRGSWGWVRLGRGGLSEVGLWRA